MRQGVCVCVCAGERAGKCACASVCYREELRENSRKRKRGISGKRERDGSGRKSLGLSLLSFLGSAVQEKRRLKWRRCF